MAAASSVAAAGPGAVAGPMAVAASVAAARPMVAAGPVVAARPRVAASRVAAGLGAAAGPMAVAASVAAAGPVAPRGAVCRARDAARRRAAGTGVVAAGLGAAAGPMAAAASVAAGVPSATALAAPAPGSVAAGAGDEPLLRVEGLRKYFPTGGGLSGRPSGWVRAVDGVSFELRRGETLGLVGESGCGKTTTGRTLLRLTPATDGGVRFEGRDVFALAPVELRRLRREMQMVFQDPYDALDPRMTLAEIVAEPLAVHGAARGPARLERVRELLELVGLGPHHLRLYPHECSGGQRQRVGIARALALSPKLVVCDEPVSSLDVSVQAQVLTLLRDLQVRFGLTYLVIAHNMAVIRQASERVAVMYLGRLVELAPSDELFGHPAHPYTEALLAAAPLPDPAARRERRTVLGGEPPSALNPPAGCRFHPRCPYAFEPCARDEPEMREVAPGHLVACHLHRAAPDDRWPGAVSPGATGFGAPAGPAGARGATAGSAGPPGPAATAPGTVATPALTAPGTEAPPAATAPGTVAAPAATAPGTEAPPAVPSSDTVAVPAAPGPGTVAPPAATASGTEAAPTGKPGKAADDEGMVSA